MRQVLAGISTGGSDWASRGENVYQYACGNPMAFYDPPGQIVPPITIGFCGMAGGFIKQKLHNTLNEIHGAGPRSSHRMAY